MTPLFEALFWACLVVYALAVAAQIYGQVFDKPRWDPIDPNAYGATITYDFDARDGGIPFQRIKEETNVLRPS